MHERQKHMHLLLSAKGHHSGGDKHLQLVLHGCHLSYEGAVTQYISLCLHRCGLLQLRSHPLHATHAVGVQLRCSCEALRTCKLAHDRCNQVLGHQHCAQAVTNAAVTHLKLLLQKRNTLLRRSIRLHLYLWVCPRRLHDRVTSAAAVR